MKKTMIFAAVAALVSLASCQKEEAIDNGTDKNASPVFTASIAGATKTTIDMTDGNVAKIAWETTDEITVTDAASASAVYTIESIDANTGKATFVIKTGETALGDGPYTATYGTAPATAQTYSATAGKLYMTAPETSNNSFTFTVQCGLMKLNLTKPDESVKSIAVTGTPTGGSETTYTLTCDPAQSIATAKDFFIALPAGSYTKIEITNAEDVTCTLNSASGVAVAANHIKPVTFDGSKLNFVLNIPDGALPGVFSVSDTKKVYFSQGNLWADASGASPVFYFETNQYDFQSSGSTSHVSHFFWSKDASVAYAASYSESGTAATDVLFTNATAETAKSDFTVNGVTGKYRTLSTNEWQYLFNTRTMKNGKDRYTLNITYGGKMGLVLYPDDYDKDPVTGTVTDLPDGVVFLPAAGSRNGSSVSNVGGLGYYWSSAAMDRDFAYNVIFSDGYPFNPGNYSSRGGGYSVRLVTDVE